MQDELFIDDDLVGVAAIGDAAQVLVRAVVGAGKADFAILLQPFGATGAGLTRVDHAAHADRHANGKILYLRANLCDATNDFVTWYDRKNRALPFGACGVEI